MRLLLVFQVVVVLEVCLFHCTAFSWSFFSRTQRTKASAKPATGSDQGTKLEGTAGVQANAKPATGSDKDTKKEATAPDSAKPATGSNGWRELGQTLYLISLR